MLAGEEVERALVQAVRLVEALPALGLLGDDAQRLCRLEHRRRHRAPLELPGETAGVLEVMGGKLGQLVALLTVGDPGRAADVQVDANPFRQPAVGDLTDQLVLELELPLARHHRRFVLLRDVEARKRLERSLHVVPDAVQARNGAGPERPADDGGPQREMPLQLGEPVEPCADHRAQTRRDRHRVERGVRVEQALVGEHVHGLLEEEWVSRRRLHGRRNAGGRLGGAEQLGDEHLALGRSQRRKREDEPPLAALDESRRRARRLPAAPIRG